MKISYLSVWHDAVHDLYLCSFTILFEAYEIRCGELTMGVYLGQSTSDHKG